MPESAIHADGVNKVCEVEEMADLFCQFAVNAARAKIYEQRPSESAEESLEEIASISEDRRGLCARSV